ncbi:MAG: DnaJ C-terminal domain-containing protein [Chloroflexota bacterium]|nr:DnaJ C-terminal domain-containing protein [Chloroflexota bacterium]
MPSKDYYQLLGVSRTASDKEIKQAYRKLARKYHPDVNPGDKSAEEKFKEINNAYEIISDTEKRKKYDQFGDKWQYADQFAGAQGGPFGGSSGFYDKGSDGFNYEYVDMSELGDLSDLFKGFTGGFGGRTRTSRARRGRAVDYAADVTLEEAFNGSTRLIQDMSGRRLEVKIPKGVKDGQRIKVAGKGEPGITGGPGGDLYLVVSVKPHSVFQRKGDDIHVEVPVPLADAILGGEASVPSPKGKNLALKIPPETQNGKVFRLAGQGMPQMGKNSSGDLFAKVKVVLPEKLTDREREFFTQLRELLKGE